MLFAGASLSGLEPKAPRGLAYNSVAYAARDNLLLLADVVALAGGTPVKAGEETAVTVNVPGLSRNSNVRAITAVFTISEPADQQTSAAQTTSVSVAEGNDKRDLKVTVDAVPGMRNVQLRLDQGQVFWTKSGAVPAGDHPIPDFAAPVNEYLDKLGGKDPAVALRFLVKSEAPGDVSIRIQDLQLSFLQTQSWENKLNSTFRIDRTLQLNFNQIERLPVDPISAAGAEIAELRLDAGGQFTPDRLLGDTETHDGGQFATISPDFSLAQNINASKDLLKTQIDCTGITGYFEADAKAEFYIELQPDDSGSPASGAPLAKANVSFTPADPNDIQGWTFAKFEKPTKLSPGTPYWIVAKGVHGSVRLGLNMAEAPPPNAPLARYSLLLNRGGQLWKSFVGPAAQPVQALLSLVYIPQPDNQTAAVQILAGDGGPTQRIDPAPKVATVHFPFSGGGPLPSALVVHSHGQGSLTIANVIQEYTHS